MLSTEGPQGPTRPERLLPDDFWMFSYKVIMCPLKTSHDWEKCIYAHHGEKARRRPPNMYQAVQCPEARAKKMCPRGELCPCTHHLFELWLHPDRFMTCLCELGPSCNRPICFFAHHASELRPLPDGLTPAPVSSSRRRSSSAAAAAAAAAAATAANGTRSSSSSPPPTTIPQGSGSLLQSGVSLASPPGSVSTTIADAAPNSLAALTSAASADAGMRPGFGALDSLQSPTSAAGRPVLADTVVAQALQLLQQQQQAGPSDGRTAAGVSTSSPSVVVLEAPTPALPVQALQLAQQYRQVNLSAAGAQGRVSPTAPLGASSSAVSLASSTGSAIAAAAGAGVDAAGPVTAGMLLDVQQQLLLRAQSVSPAGSPRDLNAGVLTAGALSGGVGIAGDPRRAGVQRLTVQQQQQQMGNGAMSALLGQQSPQQVAGMQQAVAVEDPQEHLSFSLWDLNINAAVPARSGPMSLGSVPQFGAQSGLQGAAQPQPQPAFSNMDGFSGFRSAGGVGRGSIMQQGVPVPQATALSPADAAAERLLLAQQGLQAGVILGSSTGMPVAPLAAASPVSDADTAKEARLTLLRAWMNAAAAAAGGLEAGGRAVVAQDLASVLSPREVLLLQQQLQHTMLNN